MEIVIFRACISDFWTNFPARRCSWVISLKILAQWSRNENAQLQLLILSPCIQNAEHLIFAWTHRARSLIERWIRGSHAHATRALDVRRHRQVYEWMSCITCKAHAPQGEQYPVTNNNNHSWMHFERPATPTTSLIQTSSHAFQCHHLSSTHTSGHDNIMLPMSANENSSSNLRKYCAGKQFPQSLTTSSYETHECYWFEACFCARLSLSP